MLRELAADTYGYPAQGFETLEDWRNFILKQASLLEACKEENISKMNPHTQKYMEILKAVSTIKHTPDGGSIVTYEFDGEDDDVVKKYMEKEKEIGAWQQQTIEECFANLGKHFFKLWY